MSHAATNETRNVVEGRNGGKLVMWQKGQSGNPTGKGGQWNIVQAACKQRSMQAVETLGDAMRSDDERVAITAAQKILEWAWGAPQAYKPGDDDGRMVIDLKALNSQELRLLGALLTRGAVKPSAEDDGVVVTPVTSEP